MAIRDAGVTPPACPPAALKKLDVVIAGPGGRIVSVNAAENPPIEAVTTAVPADGPACTATEACPLLPVVAVDPFGNRTGIAPVDVNCTCTPAPGPWLLFTWTTSGWAYLVLTIAS